MTRDEAAEKYTEGLSIELERSAVKDFLAGWDAAFVSMNEEEEEFMRESIHGHTVLEAWLASRLGVW